MLVLALGVACGGGGAGTGPGVDASVGADASSSDSTTDASEGLTGADASDSATSDAATSDGMQDSGLVTLPDAAPDSTTETGDAAEDADSGSMDGGCTSGSSCTTDVPNAVATCSMGTCGFACVAGFHLCGGACASSTSTETCGSACTPCAVPTNGTATCDGTSCGVACTAPYVPSGAACVVPPPRPISPMTGNTVSSRTPTLRWALPAGFTTAHVDVCEDSACSTVLWSQDVTGSSVRVGSLLPTHTIFWRLFTVDTTDGGVTSPIASPVWEFYGHGTNSASLATSWHEFADFNADGYADLLLTESGSNPTLILIPGSTSGPTGNVTWSYAMPVSLYDTGDMNGDGLIDLVVYGEGLGAETDAGTNFGIGVFLDQAGSGLPASPSYTLSPQGQVNAIVVDDLDGDGYADILSAATDALTYFGGGATPSKTPSVISLSCFQCIVSRAGDTNGDGFADVVVATSGFGGPLADPGVFFGSSGSPPIPSSPSVTLSPPNGVQFMGLPAPAGDANGDGYGDLALVTGTLTTGTATILPYYGSASGPTPTTKGLSFTSNGVGSVWAAGDMNGDGYSDLVAATGTSGKGVSVFLGSVQGWPTVPTGPSLTLGATPAGTFTQAGTMGPTHGGPFADVAAAYEGQVDWFFGAASPATTPASSFPGSTYTPF